MCHGIKNQDQMELPENGRGKTMHPFANLIWKTGFGEGAVSRLDCTTEVHKEAYSTS